VAPPLTACESRASGVGEIAYDQDEVDCLNRSTYYIMFFLFSREQNKTTQSVVPTVVYLVFSVEPSEQ